jgi:hypothetical protein
MCNHTALLLNPSNMESFPIYPYAFIQVPAVARRAGVEVFCKDLLGIPEADWSDTVRHLIEQHTPEMILITLRNTDSLDIEDYVQFDFNQQEPSAYFPIERTRALIAAIREVSALKVAVGGFGFSVMPELLMHHLRPDYGIFGGGQDFFDQFDDLKQWDPTQTANLLYFQDDHLVTNPRKFYPPLAVGEYTPRVIEEMMALYEAFPTPGFDGAPVEIMRGCPHKCLFCAEPHVTGSTVHYRPLEAVMADIGILVDSGINEIYMISSELNPQGSEFILQLADRIQAFNAGQPQDGKVSWYGANYLLGFSEEEYDRLYASGFTGGWFDLTALDDGNGRAMRTPYRNARLLPDLKIHARACRKHLGLPPAEGSSACSPENSEQGEKIVKWNFFFGNPATTVDTIRDTIRIANQEGLPQLFNRCSINTNMRVFDYSQPTSETLAVTFSINPDLERTAYQPLYPSFAYPLGVYEIFISDALIEAMFEYLAETFLSTQYQETRDWLVFVRENTSLEAVEDWIEALSAHRIVDLQEPLAGSKTRGGTTAWKALFSSEPLDWEAGSSERLAQQLVEALLSAFFEAFPSLLEQLGLPGTSDQMVNTTPYQLAVQVYTRWSTEEQLFDGLGMLSSELMSDPLQECTRYCVQVILHRFNLQIRPEYRVLFVDSGET